MNQKTGMELTHRCSPSPSTAPGEQPAQGQATCPSDGDARQQCTRRSPPSTWLSHPRNLPVLTLRRIFSYLPLSSQCHCALVCRRWYDCLPSPRTRLERWLRNNAPLSCQTDPDLGRGCNSRTRSFLQAARSPVLPAVTHLLQEQQASGPHQDTQQRPPEPTDCDLLSSLVHHGLHQQLIRADRLTLRAAPIDWPRNKLVATFTFSPCCRWLALQCQASVDAPAFLRLYSWEQDSWKRCSLVPEATEPIERRFSFTSRPVDTLLSIHGVEVLAWRRQQDSGRWHRTLVCAFPQALSIDGLFPMGSGDLVILAATKQQPQQCLMLMSLYTGDDRGWKALAPTNIATAPDVWACELRSCQLALGTVIQSQYPDEPTNEVLIWYKDLTASRPSLWGCQKSLFGWQDASIAELTYAPGGQCLLGRLTNGRIYLWTPDAQYRLQEQMTLSGYRPQSRLNGLSPFSDNGKHLALPRSLWQIQLFSRDDKGQWQPGQLVETGPGPDEDIDDTQVNVLLSSSGRTLVRRTEWRLDVWHRNSAGIWQHQLRRRTHARAYFFPQVCFMEPGELVCTTVESPRLSLWIHGPNSRGQFVRKAARTVEVALNGPRAASPDGLSLLLASIWQPPQLLQLMPPGEADANGQLPPPARRNRCCIA